MEPDEEPHPYAESIDALIDSLTAAPFHAAAAAPLGADARNRADMATFVAANPAGFLRLYDALAARRGALGWCWPGVFFPLAWFLYRKMYGWAGAACVTAVLLSNTHILPPYLAWLSLWPSIVGAFGRGIYLRGARRTIGRIRAEAPDEAAAQATLRAAGGVSIAGAVVGALLYVSILALAAQGNVRVTLGAHP